MRDGVSIAKLKLNAPVGIVHPASFQNVPIVTFLNGVDPALTFAGEVGSISTLNAIEKVLFPSHDQRVNSILFAGVVLIQGVSAGVDHPSTRSPEFVKKLDSGIPVVTSFVLKSTLLPNTSKSPVFV